MGCSYEIGKEAEVSFSLLDLTRHYYRSVNHLENNRIYSTEEIVKSTEDLILEQLRKADEIIKDDKTESLHIFQSKEQPTLLKSAGIDKGRLNPEYIEENRVINTIIENLKNEGLVIPKNIETRGDLLKLLKDNPESIDLFNKYETDIKEVLVLEEKTKNLGTQFHSLLSKLIQNNGNFDNNFKEEITDFINKNIDVLSIDMKDDALAKLSIIDWEDKFSNILSKIYSKLSGQGRILTNVRVASEEKAIAQVNGEIDIIVITNDGVAHIYDLKLSKKKYSDWDSAKILSTDYQLAFYRGLLGQHITVSKSSLNVIPIELGGFNSDGKLETNTVKLGEFEAVSIKDGMLYSTGALYRNVKKLIPEKLQVASDPERKKNFLTKLGLLLPGYEVRTSNKKNNIEAMVDRAMENKTYAIYNDYKEDYTKTMEVKSDGKTLEQIREELTKVATDYVNYLEEIKNANLVKLKGKIIEAITNKKSITGDNDAQTHTLRNTLKDYITGNYEVVNNIEELDELGMILLQNKKTSKFVLLNVSSNNQVSPFNKDLLYEDAEHIKALLFFNEFKKELRLNSGGIEDVIVLDLEAARTSPKLVQAQYEKFKEMMDTLNLPVNLRKKQISTLEQSANLLIQQNLRQYVGSESEKVLNTFGEINKNFSDISLEKLQEMVKALIVDFPELKRKRLQEMDMTNNLEYIFALLHVLIVSKAKYLPTGDYLGMKDFSIGFSDFRSIISSLYTSDQETYDKNMKRIQGLPGGLKMVTPDRIGSKDLQNINNLISLTHSNNAHIFNKQNVILTNITNDFQSKMSYGFMKAEIVGNHRKLYENLWAKKNGRISNEWKLKNPYDITDNTLSDVEREYLKKILSQIKKFSLKITDTDFNKINFSSLETIEKTDVSGKVLDSIQSGKYFEMALIRSKQIDRNWGAIKKTTNKGVGTMYGQVKDEIKELLDTRELREDDLKYINDLDDSQDEMYDVYVNQNRKHIAESVDLETEGYWELDLDRIANKVAYSAIKKTSFDKVLPIITSYVWSMKLMAGKSNQKISNVLESIKNRIEVAVFDAPIVADEAKDIVAVTKAMQQVTTAMMLGFRPVTMVKEFAIGLYKGISLASTKIYGGDQFSLADYTRALKAMLTIDNKFSLQFNLIDNINKHYRFANQDANSLDEKWKVNRRGGMLGLSPWMYSCNTYADYYNRLVLFIAKMMHDGSYEAHSMTETGEMIYDPTKDKRFSYYFENRDKHKNSQGLFVPSKSDKKYNEQRNMYNLVMGQINDERVRVGDQELKEIDLIEYAYSEKERQSYKSFTDTVYGAYDKDAQAEWHHTWYGIIFLQFLQFWPGKMNMWFGKPLTAEQSNMGKFERVYRKDADGIKKPSFLKAVYNEENPDQIDEMVPTFEDTGDPHLVWTGTPQEGLVYSIGYTIQSVLRRDWESIKDNDLKKRRMIFAMSDTVLMLLIFGMIKAIFDAFVDENGTEGISGNTAQFMQTVSKKVLNEANLWQNTLGAINTEPAFYSFGTKVAGDVQDVFTGDKSFNQLISKNVKAAEFWDAE